jgi:hypothetical protein
MILYSIRNIAIEIIGMVKSGQEEENP